MKDRARPVSQDMRLLSRWRSTMIMSGLAGKRVMGGSPLALGILRLTGLEKYLEALAVNVVPPWTFAW